MLKGALVAFMNTLVSWPVGVCRGVEGVEWPGRVTVCQQLLVECMCLRRPW